MQTKLIPTLLFWVLSAVAILAQNASPNSYQVVIEGFDWGPAVNKVILPFQENQSAAVAGDYQIFVTRKSAIGPIPAEIATGKREVQFAYVSDATGNAVKSGKFITLQLAIAPYLPISSPIHYFRGKGGGNQWVDYQMTVVQQKTQQIWNQESGRIMPLVDQFDLKGKFTTASNITMSYASFEPKSTKEKLPLIIWLHGGGEGGTDPRIPLLGNRAANYASAEIQSIFEGAYVLSPQCPGAWMHNAQGVGTQGKENDVYNEGLMALIKDFVQKNPRIDASRIYVGGCSNGGYMALKLILQHPAYFAAGYISSLAYQSQYIADQDLAKIKQVPIWFVHSNDDSTTVAAKTVIPVYNRLLTVGAKNVHLSLTPHVTDISNVFGGENYHYNGHWSWVYLHANKSNTELNGSPVRINGTPVNIMEWLSMQKIKTKKE